MKKALVKWVTGKEAGTFTKDVSLSWIQGFDPADADLTESFVVEWRVPPKPRAGWPLCDALVLEVSDDPDFLERRLREEEEKEKKAGRQQARDQEQRTPLTSRNTFSNEDIQRLLETLVQSSRVSTPSTPRHEDTENMVKVGEVLTLTRSEAKLARTPSSMTMDLVRAAFSSRRLRKSTYAGQKRMRDGLLVQKPSLKKYKKMRDIQNFVHQRFEFFSQSAFGQAVNACTGRNVDRRPPAAQLLDQSDSESEFD